MALIYNIKSGTLKSTTRIIPKAIDKDHRLRFLGGPSTIKKFDNSVCNGAVSCPNDTAGTPAIRVECDPTP